MTHLTLTISFIIPKLKYKNDKDGNIANVDNYEKLDCFDADHKMSWRNVHNVLNRRSIF